MEGEEAVSLHWWFIASWNKLSPSPCRYSEWLGGKEEEIHRRRGPVTLQWILKEPQFLSSVYTMENNGPDILHFPQTNQECSYAKAKWAIFDMIMGKVMRFSWNLLLGRSVKHFSVWNSVVLRWLKEPLFSTFWFLSLLYSFYFLLLNILTVTLHLPFNLTFYNKFVIMKIHFL